MSTGTLTVPAHHEPSARSEFAWTVATLLAGAAAVLAVMTGLGLLITKPLAHTGFSQWEGGVNRYFARHRTPLGNSLTHVGSLIGNTPAITVVAVIAFITLRLVLHRWRESLALLVTVVGEVTIFVLTTLLIDRPRPKVPHLDGAPPTSSYPSGHTAATASLYGLLTIIILTHVAGTVWRALAVVVAILLVLAVGVSRLYRGMHYPTDVVGGILLASMWLAVTTTVILGGRRLGPNHG